MTRLILLGAGKIGETITHFLQASGDYTLTVADQDEAAWRRWPRSALRPCAPSSATPRRCAN